VCGGVVGEHSLPRALADGAALGFVEVVEVAERVRGGSRNEYFGIGMEERPESLPRVADDRRGACRCLEEANAGRPSRRDHVSARDVQSEPLRIVECAMFPRRQVGQAIDVCRPANRAWILRSSDDESRLARPTGGLEEQALERWLAIVAVRPHVPNIPARTPPFRIVQLGIE
jgi:hypothetical protein